jgi:hypothetical protein
VDDSNASIVVQGTVYVCVPKNQWWFFGTRSIDSFVMNGVGVWWPGYLLIGYSDPENQESRVDSVFLNLYIPRDERHTQVRVKGVVSKEDAILAAGRKLLPALQSLYSTHQEFTSLNNVRDLYKAPDTSSSSSSSSSSTETRSSEPDEDPENQPERMTYPVPKIIAGERESC